MININTTILLNKEKNLLLNSTICNHNERLQKTLKKFDYSIKKKDLEKLKLLDYDVYRILKDKEVIKEIIENSSKEWKQERPIGIDNKPCELCGNKHSKDKFLIRNKFNNKEMKVGSSCIYKFEHIEKAIKGESLSKLRILQEKDPNSINRLIEFNEKYKSGSSIFEEWKYKFNQFNIVFPKGYDEEFIDIINKSRKFYKNFRNGIELELDKFDKFILEFNYFYKKCTKFENENENNKFIFTKDILNDLRKDNEQSSMIKIIKEKDCIIDKYFLKYIFTTNFVKRFSNEIKKFFKENDIDLLDIKDEQLNLKLKNIIFVISTQKFMRNFSEIIYKSNIIFNKKELIEQMNIYYTKENVQAFIDILSILIKDEKYYFNFNDDLYDMGKVELYDRIFKDYAEINIKDLLKNKDIFYKEKNQFKEEFIFYIKNLQWKNNSEKSKFDIGNIKSIWSNN